MSEQEIKDRVQTRSYGAVRVGQVVDMRITLAPDMFESVDEADNAVRKGPEGDWVIIRLVRTMAVGRETVIKATVTEGPAL